MKKTKKNKKIGNNNPNLINEIVNILQEII